MEKGKKRGLSPVVATVLLIAIVIIIGLIVYFWLRGTVEDAVTKFDGTNIKLVCNDVSFDADYYNGDIFISNTGKVPVYRFKARVEGGASYSTVTVGENSDTSFPKEGLNPGVPYQGSLDVGDATKIFVIPVLLGKTSSDKKESYTCEENFAKEIDI